MTMKQGKKLLGLFGAEADRMKAAFFKNPAIQPSVDPKGMGKPKETEKPQTSRRGRGEEGCR